jgi:hypothetical protein
MSYKLGKICFPKDINCLYNNGRKYSYTEERYQRIKKKLKYVKDNNLSLIYILYISSENKNCIKIGSSESYNLFLKRGGRFYTHTKNFHSDSKPILLKIIPVKNYVRTIEERLHKTLKKKYKENKIKLPYDNNEYVSFSNETYLFDKEMYYSIDYYVDKIETILVKEIDGYNRIQALAGYDSDDSFIVDEVDESDYKINVEIPNDENITSDNLKDLFMNCKNIRT